MRRWMWLVVGLLLLAACDEAPPSTPAGAPAAQGEPTSNMPLPGSEMTRVARQQKEQPSPLPPLPKGEGVGGEGISPSPTLAPPTATIEVILPSPTPSPSPTAIFVVISPSPSPLAQGPGGEVASPPPPSEQPAGEAEPPRPLVQGPGSEGRMVEINDQVRITLPDGASLSATAYFPGGVPGRLPGVILLPMHVEDRRAWDAFAFRLAESGLAVLALDLRGQGDSPGPANWPQAVQDVLAAWQQFGQSPRVEAENISLVGASVGANLALQALQVQPRIRSAALISPGVDFLGVPGLPEQSKLVRRRVLVLGSLEDPISVSWPAELAQAGGQDFELQMYPGSAHGTYLLASQPATQEQVSGWLAKQAAQPAPAVPSVSQARPADQRPPVPQPASPLISALASLACLVGLFFLALGAAIAVVRARRLRQTDLALPAAGLPDRRDWVSVQGKILQVLQRPILGQTDELAALRLRIEVPDAGGHWVSRYDQTLLKPFLLNIAGGAMQVDPAAEGVLLRGEGFSPTHPQLRAAAIQLKTPQALLDQPGQRITLWQLRVGDEVLIKGDYQDQQRLLAREVGRQAPEIPLTPSMDLQPGQRQAALRGQIIQVDSPIDRHPEKPLALVRLLVETYDTRDGWVIIGDVRRACRAFLLQDQHGSVWVEAQAEGLIFQGQGGLLSDEQARKALLLPGMPRPQPGQQFRIRLWQYRRGDAATLLGSVTRKERAVLAAHEIEPGGVGVRLAPIIEARPDAGRWRLHGRIAEVPRPLDPGLNPAAPLAVLRLVIEEETSQGWSVRLDEARAGLFRLQDGSGSILVAGVKPPAELFGEGTPTSQQKAEEALHVLGLPVHRARGKRLRFWIWEYRLGQSISLSGYIHTQTWLSDSPEPGLLPVLSEAKSQPPPGLWRLVGLISRPAGVATVSHSRVAGLSPGYFGSLLLALGALLALASACWFIYLILNMLR